MRRIIPSPLFGVFLLYFPLSSFSSDNINISSNHKKIEDLCGMYLAPSTIPGAGMGVFAGHRDIRRGDYLLTDDGDLVVPVYEMTNHVGHSKYNFLWEEYTWKAASYDGMNEEVDNVRHVKACSTGLGAAINCILPLVNVVDDYDNRRLGLSGIDIGLSLDSMNSDGDSAANATATLSVSSPGVGAFSPYHNRRWKAKRYIPAGMELYGNYGEGYFKSRSSSYGKVPLKKNYREIDKLLKEYQRITTTTTSSGSTSTILTGELKKDLLIYLQSLSTIWKDSRNMNAIPQTDPLGDHAVVDWLLEQSGGSGMIHYNSSIRELDWLQEHGRCMDNIRDGISKIPHSGRGAFARRKIPQGTIVAPAPLIQIPDREIFTIYDKKSEKINEEGDGNDNYDYDYELVADHDKPVHHQLLLNYCFGHVESSLLLCPYGLMTSHINHDATNPNTMVVWSADDQMAHPEWREKSIKKWGTKAKAGLSFDFVALRDIERDEEITIDYGSEWEEAWQNHLRSYHDNDETNDTTKDKLMKHHVPAFELNELVGLKLQTMEEGDYENQGLHLFCRGSYVEWYGAAGSLQNGDDHTLLVRVAGTNSQTTEIKRKDYSDWNDEEVYPCRIRQRYIPNSNNKEETEEGSNASYKYFVEVFERSDEVQQPWESSDTEEITNRRISTTSITQDFVWAVLFGVPRDAFYFKDQKKCRHHHQIRSFRHEMRVPDDIFPAIWRNKR